MSTPNEPFNIEIMHLTPGLLRGLGKVESLDYFDTSTGEFHPQGLFSSEIFGLVGDRLRRLRFGYIDIKASVFHPVIFKSLISLRRFYADLIAGRKYAKWNPETKDFDESDPFDGQTGFAFFLRHWAEIEFKRTDSFRRDDRIQLIERYKESALTSKIIVLPAALRDLEVQEDGRPVADEINDFYRRLIGVSNTIPDAALRNNPEIVDASRYRAQLTFNELYEFIESLIKGKKKLFMGKYASRRIQDGTRNVISSLVVSTPELGAPGSITMNDTVVGLYQTLVAIRPVSIHRLLTGILSEVFISPDIPTRLIDKKTLQQVEVELEPDQFDRWTTTEGLNKVIGTFASLDVRHRPVEVAGHYVALIYKGPDNTFRVFTDIRDLPADLSKKYVTPITLAELFYHAIYPVANNYPVFVTRYPISGVGSIYPSMIHLTTTSETETRRELGINWQINEELPVAATFPIVGHVFHDTTTPHTSRIKAMGGDFDGDMVSLNALYSNESIQEVRDHLSLRRAYIGTDGQFKFSITIPPIELVLYNLTGV